MKLGFTGTREGISAAQKEWLRQFVRNNADYIDEVHHGDCVGGDNEFDDIVREIASCVTSVIVHPSNVEKLRAYVDCKSSRAGRPMLKTVMLEPRPPILRDCVIVEEVDVLIVMPKGKEPQRHSGTWFTYRYAKKKEKIVYLVFQDGSLKQDE